MERGGGNMSLILLLDWLLFLLTNYRVSLYELTWWIIRKGLGLRGCRLLILVVNFTFERGVGGSPAQVAVATGVERVIVF
jgi:hypothetical protein